MSERELSPAADMAVRWAPDPAAVRLAVAAMGPWEGADVVAFVPMYQPGKDHGVWFAGQEVGTVPGVVFVATTGWDPAPGLASYPAARDQAAAAGYAALNGRPGTAGHAVVYPDGEWAVFEDPPPRGWEPAETDPERGERLPHTDGAHFCTPRCAAYPPPEKSWHQHTAAGPADCGRCQLARAFPEV